MLLVPAVSSANPTLPPGPPGPLTPQAMLGAPLPHFLTPGAVPPTPLPVSFPAGVPIIPGMPLPSTPLSVQRELPVLHSGIKRSSEELLATQMVTNGNGPIISAVGADGLEAPKKVKLDGSPETPSKVIHIRSIPSDCTEAEIVQLGLPFGRMHNILMLKQKNQAFLEMEDETVASAMVNYYNDCQATVRGRKVYLQYSNHRELKTDQHSQLTLTGNPLQSVPGLTGEQVVLGALDQGGAKPILRVIIDNLLYPVTIDTLHQIFSRYGSVLRIVTFTKNNTFQALVQFPEVQTAQTAKQALDGMNIYNGCCTLRIDYSKLTTLSVRYNNDKSRDYTNPTLPSGEASPTGQTMNIASALGRGLGTIDAATFGGIQMSPFVSVPGVVSAPAMAPVTPMASTISPELAGVPLHTGHLGSPLTDPLQQNQLGQLLAQTTPAPPADPQLLGLTAIPGLPVPGSFGMTGINLQGQLSGLAAGLQIPGVTIGSSVVLVSNLNEQMVTPDSLFTLFGVYGDVIRVKVLFNKKDNALIQYSEPQMAQLAITHLDKAVLWGKSIRVAPSKHTLVQMPREGQADAGLTKDFTNSPLHRFKKPGSKNFQNIFPPSLVLHLSNIPGTVSEEELTDQFVKFGSIVAFKFFPKDRKMALVQMSSVEESIAALIGMHDCQLAEGQNLRVSFSKSKI